MITFMSGLTSINHISNDLLSLSDVGQQGVDLDDIVWNSFGP